MWAGGCVGKYMLVWVGVCVGKYMLVWVGVSASTPVSVGGGGFGKYVLVWAGGCVGLGMTSSCVTCHLYCKPPKLLFSPTHTDTLANETVVC